ncbi:MAG: SDR family oxidoreductase [Candidatus Omnitrophota bacterium]
MLNGKWARKGESVEPRTAIIVGVSSDIGLALARRWLEAGWRVFGTYRNWSPMMGELAMMGSCPSYCNLGDAESTGGACHRLGLESRHWDVLVLAAGAQEPVGPFEDVEFMDWEGSIRVNFVAQMQVVHKLLPFRCMDTDPEPLVLFFAGGGTNNATVNYSAYTVSKIALIKMCELLDAEIPDTRFCILGPGWVKTKIHETTLAAGPDLAGDNYQRTLDKLASDECTPMETVLDCIDWAVKASRDVVSGRNFSVVHDAWGSVLLEDVLRGAKDMYKLRRHGNDLLVRGK